MNDLNTMTTMQADAVKQKADLAETFRIMRGIKKSPHWEGFRTKFLEKRRNEAQLEVMKPCNTMEQQLHAERAKGAFLAFEGLLAAFSVDLPAETGGDDET